MRELATNTEAEKPTMESKLEFNGPKMDPAMESTPHANTQIYNNTYEGAELMPNCMDDDSEVTQGADRHGDTIAIVKRFLFTNQSMAKEE